MVPPPHPHRPPNKNPPNPSIPAIPGSDNNLTPATSVVYLKTDRHLHSAAQTCADPVPNGHRDHVRKRRQNGIDSATNHRAESQRLWLLRRRPSPDRQSGARSGGPCRSVGGPVSGARRISPASQSEPADIPSPLPYFGFPPLCGGNVRRTKGARGMPCQGPGNPRGADIHLLLSAAGGRLQRE